LDRATLRKILTEPKNSIVKQYVKLFEMDGVALKFDEEVFDYIVDKAIEFKLGARGLRSIVETMMMDAMFDVPSSQQKHLHVTKEFAEHNIEASHLSKLKLAN
jgi:ATP-dependent Clp protease ATP-binding subunit ClpX